VTRRGPRRRDHDRRLTGRAPVLRGSGRRARVLLAGLALGVAGCTAVRPPGTGVAGLPSPGSPDGGSPVASARPRDPAVPSERPIAPQPPSALLSVNVRGAYAGELGSYLFRGTGSDSPWIPARTLRPVTVRAGAVLSVRLERGLIGPWSADVAPARDEQGAALTRLGGNESGVPSRRSVRIPAPPRGSWVLMINVGFADGSGSAAYYWRIDVS
jgi:hypothetical protein